MANKNSQLGSLQKYFLLFLLCPSFLSLPSFLPVFIYLHSFLSFTLYLFFFSYSTPLFATFFLLFFPRPFLHNSFFPVSFHFQFHFTFSSFHFQFHFNLIPVQLSISTADARCAANGTEFQCGNGQCIKAKGRCDTRIDCLDMSDELDCGR